MADALRRVVRAHRPKTLGPPDRNPYLVYIASLGTATSRATMRSSLQRLARDLGAPSAEALPWHEMRYQHTHALRARLAEGYAPATAKRIISAIRGVLRQCYRLGLMTEADYRRAIDLPPVRGSRVARGRALSQNELVSLFKACKMHTPLGTRDAALVALLYGGGLRRSEAVSIRIEDLTEADGGAIIVRGKGNKERTVWLPEGTMRAIEPWLAMRGPDPGPLLLATADRGRAVAPQPWQHMCPESVRNALRKLAKRAGVRHCSPHDMRRTFVGDLLDAGADLATVQQMAGHSDASTTARYDRRGERSKQKASKLLKVPFS